MPEQTIPVAFVKTKPISELEEVSVVEPGSLLFYDGGDSLKRIDTELFYQLLNNISSSNEKELMIRSLGGNGVLGSTLLFDGQIYYINRHLGGNTWLEVILQNSGEIVSGVLTPYKIVSQRVRKLYGFIDIDEGVATGNWTSFTSNDPAPYIGHKSKRTFDTNDTIVFTKEFEGDLDLYYVGDTDGGIVSIIIDDYPEVFVDTYSSTGNNFKQKITVATDLPLRTHTITVKNTGTKNPLSSGYQAWINAFSINSTKLKPNSDLIKPKVWSSGKTINQFDEVIGANGLFYVAASSGVTGATKPSHTSGTASDGGVSWTVIATTSYLSKDFFISVYGSETEYAYESRLTESGTKNDVGGNLHGNEILTELNIFVNTDKVVVLPNIYYKGDVIQIEQKIVDYYGDYSSKTDIANVNHNHIFTNEDILLKVTFDFIQDVWLGYFYAGMFPFLTYHGPTSRKQFYEMESPNFKVDLADYEGVSGNPIVGNKKDFIAWAIGESYVPTGVGGVPSVLHGEGKVLIALKCDSTSLNDFVDSEMNCGLAANVNGGDYTGYDSWLSKIYFQRISTTPKLIPNGTHIEINNRYYAKLFN